MATSRRVMLLTAAVSGAALATSAWGLVLSGIIGTPNVGGIGFELVIIASAVVGILYGLGRFGPDGGLTPALVALSLVVAGGLMLVAIGRSPGAALTHPLFLARFALAGLLVVASVVLALGDRAECWMTLWRGAGAVAGAGVLGGAAWGLQRVTAGGSRAVHLVGLIGAILLVLVVCALACVGVHLMVRAFERAIELRRSVAPAPKPVDAGSEQGVRHAAG